MNNNLENVMNSMFPFVAKGLFICGISVTLVSLLFGFYKIFRYKNWTFIKYGTSSGLILCLASIMISFMVNVDLQDTVTNGSLGISTPICLVLFFLCNIITTRKK